MNENKSGGKAVKSISIMAVLILLAKFMGLFRENAGCGHCTGRVMPAML